MPQIFFLLGISNVYFRNSFIIFNCTVIKGFKSLFQHKWYWHIILKMVIVQHILLFTQCAPIFIG